MLAYYPLWGLHDPEPELSGKQRSLTLNNGPTRYANPPNVHGFYDEWAAASVPHVPSSGAARQAMHSYRQRRIA